MTASDSVYHLFGYIEACLAAGDFDQLDPIVLETIRRLVGEIAAELDLAAQRAFLR